MKKFIIKTAVVFLFIPLQLASQQKLTPKQQYIQDVMGLDFVFNDLNNLRNNLDSAGFSNDRGIQMKLKSKKTSKSILKPKLINQQEYFLTPSYENYFDSCFMISLDFLFDSSTHQLNAFKQIITKMITFNSKLELLKLTEYRAEKTLNFETNTAILIGEVYRFKLNDNENAPRFIIRRLADVNIINIALLLPITSN